MSCEIWDEESNHLVADHLTFLAGGGGGGGGWTISKKKMLQAFLGRKKSDAAQME